MPVLLTAQYFNTTDFNTKNNDVTIIASAVVYAPQLQPLQTLISQTAGNVA